MVTSHLIQTLLDSYIAARWAAKDEVNAEEILAITTITTTDNHSPIVFTANHPRIFITTNDQAPVLDLNQTNVSVSDLNQTNGSAASEIESTTIITNTKILKV